MREMYFLVNAVNAINAIQNSYLHLFTKLDPFHLGGWWSAMFCKKAEDVTFPGFEVTIERLKLPFH